MEEKLVNQMNVKDLPVSKKAAKTVNSKPYSAIGVCLIVSIIMIVTDTVMILGVIVLIIALLVLWKIPSFKTMELYEDTLVIYNAKNKDICQYVEYKDIKEWIVRQGKTGGDMLSILLENGEYVNAESFNSVKIVHALNKYIPDKEANKIKNNNVQNTPLKWPWKK